MNSFKIGIPEGMNGDYKIELAVKIKDGKRATILCKPVFEELQSMLPLGGRKTKIITWHCEHLDGRTVDVEAPFDGAFFARSVAANKLLADPTQIKVQAVFHDEPAVTAASTV